ncbi:F0F1 ATP synthase subunit gamma [Corynebacterium jeikeium]|uniref:ATP synthase gamma chain n=1 Tax=Corynebacterium jeikeium (strain K411) TaxID=306537 RepID=ATPG_CORJK|nr:F0F1 ATP synthase subunit gamma [Corynebacterium jeikeium]Q4JUJ9.1 RecName: Full=ATP synthase gamma chain; AltName: Full=ATP synthase F1 sector gamma subunit; AltName: Full=F-ATPase gamma subunit [Corynebacterium jeikeium K411]EEW17516.1 ATP synthase F1, gamma subunit [Corynebacterium jeikeium ATCC 43734]OOD32177.1 ATP synthase subunit gamma [Corynebacterium jeikeium]WCZ53950.1 ATP synthase gamma chain [Corynebacterium jeikeium]CAI37508.1 ATP synthase gamma chain [Corynebacterium jeikeium K
MASLRELRTRIKSVNSTKKITKAQELIATSRITKAQARVDDAEPYADEITRVVQRLAAASTLDHKILQEPTDASRAAILVVSSDRGMCGGYNNNVFKKTAELRKRLENEGKDVVLYVSGNKGISYYNFRGEDIAGAWSGYSQDPDYAATHDVRRHLIDGFVAGSEGTAKWREGLKAEEGQAVQGFDEVHIVYTRFESMLSQKPEAHRLLPIETVVEEEKFELGEDLVSDKVDHIAADYDFEPDPDTLLKALLPQYVSRGIFAAMLESAASESAARRTAMSAATDNATDLVKQLSRVANQARQAQITQEITEIVGGASALADSGESD